MKARQFQGMKCGIFSLAQFIHGIEIIEEFLKCLGEIRGARDYYVPSSGGTGNDIENISGRWTHSW